MVSMKLKKTSANRTRVGTSNVLGSFLYISILLTLLTLLITYYLLIIINMLDGVGSQLQYPHIPIIHIINSIRLYIIIYVLHMYSYRCSYLINKT